MIGKNMTKTLFIAAATTLLAFLTNSAQAQMEYMAEAMQPEYMARDLVVFAEGLNLDDTQEVIVEAMFDSYEDDFQNGWAETQERLNRVAEEIQAKGPSSNRDTLEPVLNALGDWLIAKRQLDDGLLENVKAILVEDQHIMWPGFTQKLYREKHVSKGRLSGESVNLFQIVRDTELSPVAENSISDHLEEYAIALDGAMRTRDAILRGNPKKLFDNILSGDNSKSPDLVDGVIKARIEVRDLNDRYIEIISGNLAVNDGEDFRNRALKRGYTRIFRRTPAERIFRQAAENESYDEGIRAQIVALELSYLQELGIINDGLLNETRKFEPAMHRSRELAGQVRKQGGSPQKLDDPTRELYKKREELGKKYIEMLRALLSEDQFLELDGARRWIPRNEQQNTNSPSVAPQGKNGGLSLNGNNATKGKGKDAKGNAPKPKGDSTTNSLGGGMGRPGS